MHRRRDLEGPAPGHNGSVLDGVLHGPEAVAHGVLDLVDGVPVRPVQQECAALGVSALLDERELVVPQRHLAHLAGPAEL